MSDVTGAKIEKYVVNINGVKLELDPEQAKELWDILDKLLGKSDSYWAGITKKFLEAKKRAGPQTSVVYCQFPVLVLSVV